MLSLYLFTGLPVFCEEFWESGRMNRCRAWSIVILQVRPVILCSDIRCLVSEQSRTSYSTFVHTIWFNLSCCHSLVLLNEWCTSLSIYTNTIQWFTVGAKELVLMLVLIYALDDGSCGDSVSLCTPNYDRTVTHLSVWHQWQKKVRPSVNQLWRQHWFEASSLALFHYHLVLLEPGNYHIWMRGWSLGGSPDWISLWNWWHAVSQPLLKAFPALLFI